ncbi:hypothetical protein M433DRAFT_58580 [Acidomyces richmondensis BFW]|nr:MAG: hypothetical protein FE78DRAFT_80957 [Acidomyces sp. 'richmondensis']KYG49735.1 hypothetical protein M433DRAFT_58580 [Acidomyces richmondensis BFW]
MPRLVRRAPLSERLRDYLNPHDFVLWLAEELNDDVYDEWLQAWSTPIGIGLNFLFILARGASVRTKKDNIDDVFGDSGGSGWFTWFATFLVHLLTLLCCVNALYAFLRNRNYRLFEQPVDVPLPTPNARRVKVDSPPLGFSPLQNIRKLISSMSADSRAHPDAEKEVWEISVWDPKPASLTIFTLFSPGHLLLYFSVLPPAALDPRPSITVVTTMGFGALLSLQLIFLKNSFGQQAKDLQLIHGEVMNEYDTKFVRPSLNRPVRDVAIQTRESCLTPRGTKTREVDIYTPTTIVNRGFRTSPNPYVAQESTVTKRSIYPQPSSSGTPLVNGDLKYFSQSRPSTTISTGTSAADFSSPLKPHHERLRERSPVKGDGGSMGFYSNSASPLKKAASTSHLRKSLGVDGRKANPLQRMSTPGGGLG